MRRPLLVAIVVLLCAHAVWLVHAHLVAPAGSALWAVPCGAVSLGAFCAASLANRRKVLTGILVALPASALFVVGNAALQALGHRIVFLGVEGSVALFLISLLVSALLATAGAGLACLSPYRPV
jgi:hypothetical protein